MSMDLVNKAGSTRCTVFFWGQLLGLARMYGWKPAGTQAPRDWSSEEEGRAWSGDYVSNSGQIVSAEDAAGLANAMERGLDDIPEFYAAWHKADKDEDGKPWIPAGKKLSPLEALSGENKPEIREFIAFCRQGAFEIR